MQKHVTPVRAAITAATQPVNSTWCWTGPQRDAQGALDGRQGCDVTQDLAGQQAADRRVGDPRSSGKLSLAESTLRAGIHQVGDELAHCADCGGCVRAQCPTRPGLPGTQIVPWWSGSRGAHEATVTISHGKIVRPSRNSGSCKDHSWRGVPSARQLLLPLRWGYGMDVTVAIETCLEAWAEDVAQGRMSLQTLDKWSLLLSRFGRFAAAHGVMDIEDVTGALAGAFVGAAGRDRRGERAVPAVTTRSNRRTVLRAMVTTLRLAGLVLDDPTAGIVLPARVRAGYRPVTSEEASELRFFAYSTRRQAHRAAVVALALAGAHSGEISQITIGDVDLEQRTITLPGSTFLIPRTVVLPGESLMPLADRIAYLRGIGADGKTPLAGSGAGSPAQQQARVCTLITAVINLAGLGDDPAIRPTSLTAYAGLAAFQRSGRVEDAARVLGVKSLDRAAMLIGYDWAGEPQ